MADEPTPPDITENVVPDLAPPPVVVRDFVPAPWHRPRKQYIRKHQWNHELVEQVIKKRPTASHDAAVRVFGLPSHEYLDLLSMRTLCEQHDLRVVYLGFNNSYTRPPGAVGGPAQPVDLYQELQARRMIDASSFVHPASRLVPDYFEQIRRENSMSRTALKNFGGDFDVINLDLCGCVIGTGDQATHALEAIAELLRWQSTRRLTPWLFCVTTFASPTEINLPGCKPLIDAVKANADDSEDFRNDLTAKVRLEVDALVACFTVPGSALPAPSDFVRIFALGVGKWLAARLLVPNPPSFATLLPSYCFRHEGRDEPQLLSLAYLVEPAPSAGAAGVLPAPGPAPDHAPRYQRHARKLLAKSFDLRDLDQLMQDDAAKRREAADETEQLLVDCGFDPTAVGGYLAAHR